MSTGLELIPVALAIGAVVARRRRRQAARGPAPAIGAEERPAERDREVLELETRFRDGELLREALAASGPEPVLRDGYLHGAAGDIAIALAPGEDGVYGAFFHGEQPLEEAQAALRELDARYGALVQRDVHARVRERAAEHGMAVEEDRVDEDGSRILTLRVAG